QLVMIPLSSFLFLVFIMTMRPPGSTIFPYATLFRSRVNQVSFNFVTGVGRDTGIAPIETDPQVSISWSNDGGRTFGNELLRSLGDRKSTRLNSSHVKISYAVFCLKKKKSLKQRS